MKIIILIITLSFLCPPNQAQQKNSNEDYSNYSSDSIGAYYGALVGKLTIKFIVDSSGDVDILKSIKIYSGHRLIQKIIVNKELWVHEFSLDDYNFDGYKDIIAVAFPGQHGDSFWIWNYSPRDKRFYYNKYLSDQMGLFLDRRFRHIQIYTHQSGSEGGVDTYKYNRDKLVLLSSEYHNTVRHNSTLWYKSSFKRWIEKKWVTRIDSTKE